MNMMALVHANALRESLSLQLKKWCLSLCCGCFGHRADNLAFAATRSQRPACQCGALFLGQGSKTRVRHNVPCFLFGHSYIHTGARDDHREYVCIRCGHPLLFPLANDPYTGCCSFDKKVRYSCNLFGHKVHAVVERDGFVEYACYCGHPFLRCQKSLTVVRHPPTCLFLGHFISFTEHRGKWAEYACATCGHTFCFAVNDTGDPLPSFTVALYSR